MINISIITSIYRSEAFLEHFLYHVSNIINLDECELILVHNDPTPAELAILARCTGTWLNLVHLPVEREGLYASWNRAIRAASGKYLAVWNVDDIRTPESLVLQKRALDKSFAMMCYGDFYGTRIYGTYADKRYEYKRYEDCRQEAFRRHLIGCFPMWRKTLHETAGYFDEQFRLVGDYEFQLRVVSRFSLVKADRFLGYYLEYAGHKLSSNRRLQQRERAVVDMRYHGYHRVLLHTLPFITKYHINSVLDAGSWKKVSGLVPGLNTTRLADIGSLLRMPFAYCWWFVKRGLQAMRQPG